MAIQKAPTAATVEATKELADKSNSSLKPSRKKKKIQPAVIQRGKQGVTQSENIAAVFHKPHKNVMRLIETKTSRLIKLDRNPRLYFEPSNYIGKDGKEHVSFELTRKGFDFLVLSFTGEKADSFKLTYIDKFHAFEQAALLEQAHLLNDEWREVRAIGKTIHHGYTEQCKVFMEYAEVQRGNGEYAKFFYSNLATAKLKVLFTFPVKIKLVRNLLNADQLRKLEALDDVADVALAVGMVAELPYKEIYKLTVQAIKTDALLHGGVKPVVL